MPQQLVVQEADDKKMGNGKSTGLLTKANNALEAYLRKRNFFGRFFQPSEVPEGESFDRVDVMASKIYVILQLATLFFSAFYINSIDVPYTLGWIHDHRPGGGKHDTMKKCTEDYYDGFIFATPRSQCTTVIRLKTNSETFLAFIIVFTSLNSIVCSVCDQTALLVKWMKSMRASS